MKRRLLTILLVACALALVACGNKNKRKPINNETIRAIDAEAQRIFDEGVAALEQEQWATAIEKFHVVQSTYPDDPIATVAELYAGRAGLQVLSVLAPAESTPNVDEGSLASLAQLAAGKVDERVKWGAASYYAAGLATLGRHFEASAALADYPSPALSPVVLEPDRPAVQALIAEGLLGAARYEDAVHAYAGLWHLTATEDTRAFAKSRGFEAAARLGEAKLVDARGHDSEFVRGVMGAVLLERRAHVASDDETAALQQLLRELAPDLATIGEPDRLESISAVLASRRPPQRLAIGVALPLSGQGAAAGRAALDGALVAVDAYDADAATTTLVFADSASADAKAEVAKLKVAGVAAIIGPLDHAKQASWASAANDAEIPLFALTAKPLGDAAGDWGFRWFIDPESEARAVARVALKDQGDSRIVVLKPGLAYGRQSAEWFVAEAQAGGATILLDEEYDRSKTDYSRLAARVAKLRPDAIFIPDTATKVGEISAFLAQANVWGIDGTRRPDPGAKRVQVHYLGTSLWKDGALLRQARSYIAGALIPAWSSGVFDDDVSRQFAADFTAAAGREPSDMAAFSADAVRFVRQAFATGATDPLSIRDLALRPTLTRGITGPTRFGNNGEAIRILRFLTVTDGQFTPSPRTANVGLEDGV